MEDNLDYSADPSEGEPIWTEAKTTLEGFYSFENELSEEIRGLPPISSPQFKSLSLPEDTLVNQEFISQLISPCTLAFAKPQATP